MLILTRRIGENFVINENVMVRILGVRGNQVRVGVEAPSHIPVHREEIFKNIMKERNSNISLAKRRED